MPYEATFTPQAWVNDYAINVDPEGPTRWDCTEFVNQPVLDYLGMLEDRRNEHLSEGVLDNDDVFKRDPAAPEWIREWRGPFSIYIRKV